jgi:single-strand DNA-binding protein
MKDVNTLVLTGRLTRDPELKYSSKGTAICKFSVANDQSYKENKQVNFFDVTAFGKVGEIVAEYKKKGEPVLIEGRIQQERWEKDGDKRSKVSIIANTVSFLPTGKKKQDTSDVIDHDNTGGNDDEDDEIPF